MKPLVLALILGGIVGAGGATAFALNSFSGPPSTQLEQPAAQTSSATAPASVGPEVRVLARVGEPGGAGRIVAVRQGGRLATSFHPELTGDDRVHRYFVDLVRAGVGPT